MIKMSRNTDEEAKTRDDNDRSDDHDPRDISSSRAHEHRFEISFAARIAVFRISLLPSSWESVVVVVVVAVMMLLHLAVASAGGRAASTRRK